MFRNSGIFGKNFNRIRKSMWSLGSLKNPYRSFTSLTSLSLIWSNTIPISRRTNLKYFNPIWRLWSEVIFWNSIYPWKWASKLTTITSCDHEEVTSWQIWYCVALLCDFQYMYWSFATDQIQYQVGFLNRIILNRVYQPLIKEIWLTYISMFRSQWKYMEVLKGRERESIVVFPDRDHFFCMITICEMLSVRMHGPAETKLLRFEHRIITRTHLSKNNLFNI